MIWLEIAACHIGFVPLSMLVMSAGERHTIILVTQSFHILEVSVPGVAFGQASVSATQIEVSVPGVAFGQASVSATPVLPVVSLAELISGHEGV